MKAVFIYDGECGFCKKCARRWKRRFGASVDFRPFQELGNAYPHIDPNAFKASPHFIDERGRVFTKGASIVELFARGRGPAWHRWGYTKVPFMNRLIEYLFKKVSSCRECADKLTSVFWRD